MIELNLEDQGSRSFIVVQLPEPVAEGSNASKAGFSTIAEIGRERTRRVIDRVRQLFQEQLDLIHRDPADLGFKAFQLADSNFRVWDGRVDRADAEEMTKQLDLHVDHRRDGSTPEDIVHEILLKIGYSLTTTIETIQLKGSKVYSIDSGALLICLERHITSELIDALADANASQVICLDEGFRGNDQLKVNAVQTFKSLAQTDESEVVFWTV